MKDFIQRSLVVLLLGFAPAIFAANDPEDNEGVEEHPEVTRFPGFRIDSSSVTDFDEFLFASKGYNGDYEPIGEVKAGKHWFVDYCAKEDVRKPSAIELLRNYENAFKKAGGKLINRFPKNGDPESAVYRVPLGQGGERWVQINIENNGERYQLHIVDVGAMAQKVEFSADQMAEALKKDGFVALSGILFDTGKAEIKPDSQPMLDEIVALLTNESSLKLSVEGHTDNVGDGRANRELSKRRAESVVKYLIGKGIAAKRLKSEGKGDTAPVADNRTEQGRAKNRRVELVKF